MNTCLVCSGPLPDYKGKGRMPEIHSACGQVKHSITRLEVALEQLPGDYSRQQLLAMRTYLAGEVWRMVNTRFNAIQSRRPPRSPKEQVQALVKRLSRTATGRQALAACGLAEASSACAGGISREKVKEESTP